MIGFLSFQKTITNLNDRAQPRARTLRGEMIVSALPSQMWQRRGAACFVFVGLWACKNFYGFGLT
jgi:hypothetical protein